MKATQSILGILNNSNRPPGHFPRAPGCTPGGIRAHSTFRNAPRGLIILCIIIAMCFPVKAAEKTSKNNKRIKRFFERHPEADANKDGVCTEKEARAYNRKMRKKQGKERGKDNSRDSRKKKKKQRGKPTAPEPIFENAAYGPHERNVLDFWKAESSDPAPVIIYIHGGGFIKGDKSKTRFGKMGANIKKCITSGVSYAAVNYRLRSTTTLDNIMLDAARAVQFLRSKAKEWNIDKKRIAAFGSSAGGGASLWLAVHEDVAVPGSKDPVLRESSRLCAAGHLNSQATYDCEKWAKIVDLPASWAKDMGMTDDLGFYHIKSRDKVNSSEATKIRKKVDMLAFMDKNDPPIYLHNTKPDIAPKNKGQVIHHVRHAKYLKKRCDEFGIEALLITGETPKDEMIDVIDFFFRHFKIEKK